MIKTFKELHENKNTHMTHIEDKVIYGGAKGTREAINALRELRDVLSGKKVGQTLSTKWDGAPAIFAGQDPTDGKFFVAKKGIFNANPQIYKTPEDVDKFLKGDLAVKMKDALLYLPELGIKGVIQGDFLFGKGDVKTKKIDGTSYTTFHPNTIVYAVPYEQAKPIRDAKIGIVWHTTYKGNTFDSMSATFGVNVSKLKKSKNVWSQDAMLRSVNATLTQKETENVNELLSQAGKLFNQISGTTLKVLEGNPTLAGRIETFNNTFVRAGQTPGDSKKHTAALIAYINKKFQKEIDSRKTEKGKGAQVTKRDEEIKFFSPQNRASLEKMFELQKVIVLAKLKLINKLNSLKKIDTFVRTKQGYTVTGEEGYVAIDKLGGDAVKLVDRMEFSYNNFSPNILKGWEKS